MWSSTAEKPKRSLHVSHFITLFWSMENYQLNWIDVHHIYPCQNVRDEIESEFEAAFLSTNLRPVVIQQPKQLCLGAFNKGHRNISQSQRKDSAYTIHLQAMFQGGVGYLKCARPERFAVSANLLFVLTSRWPYWAIRCRIKQVPVEYEWKMNSHLLGSCGFSTVA